MPFLVSVERILLVKIYVKLPYEVVGKRIVNEYYRESLIKAKAKLIDQALTKIIGQEHRFKVI